MGCRSVAQRKARSTSVPLGVKVSSMARVDRPTAAAVWQTGQATPSYTPSTGRLVGRGGGEGVAWVGQRQGWGRGGSSDWCGAVWVNAPVQSVQICHVLCPPVAAL